MVASESRQVESSQVKSILVASSRNVSSWNDHYHNLGIMNFASTSLPPVSTQLGSASRLIDDNKKESKLNFLANQSVSNWVVLRLFFRI